MLVNLIIEKEKRAYIIMTSIIGFNSIMWSLFIWNSQNAFTYTVNLTILVFIFVFICISLISYFPKIAERELSNISQYDERNIMFARNNLDSNPELYKLYYKDNPEKEKTDIEIHKKGDFAGPSKTYFDKYLTPAYDAAFTLLDIERENVKIEIEKKKTEYDKTKLTEAIKFIAKTYGAIDLGITELKPYHFYSHKGRHPEGWGKKVGNSHKWGITIVVPMDIEMIQKAPSIYVIVESAKAYVEGAKIANIIETYIKRFGYDAKSHTDGNYETLCVPIALDAGLGELSRMGIMIHKEYGPCIRLAVTTTDIELVPTKGKTQHIDSFCKICKKCSDNCPTGSIEEGDETKSRGFTHWSINQEKCFSFWKNIGTDCGFCLRVCPYTKPNTLFHKIIRFYSSRNPLNQYIALFSDDILFGRKFKIPRSNKE
jgi:reductive dehalogenase